MAKVCIFCLVAVNANKISYRQSAARLLQHKTSGRCDAWYSSNGLSSRVCRANTRGQGSRSTGEANPAICYTLLLVRHCDRCSLIFSSMPRNRFFSILRPSSTDTTMVP